MKTFISHLILWIPILYVFVALFAGNANPVIIFEVIG